ncbi:hypothetical protein sos41_10600 [Alphaproteobacteria bacterium SO-S41]|nr:hypothetical protein sos41_10600 [Alphaproteobacteria bacterium SO-S41]
MFQSSKVHQAGRTLTTVMIKYDLVCRKDHRFEGWFASSSAYDDEAGKGRVTCPVCNSKKIAKAPMAPAVKGGDMPSPAEMRNALVKLRRHVESNAEHVGDRFADEARAIHHGDADDRPIYGEATAEDSKALKEEGIAVTPIPWIPLGDA